MTSAKRQLFLEAQELEQELLRLYFDTEQNFGATKYNAYRVAGACQQAFARKARRRDAMLNELTVRAATPTQGR